MRPFLIALAIPILALSGCQTSNGGGGGIGMVGSPMWHMTASQDTKVSAYTSTCSAYGFKPNTPEMAQCVAAESRNSKTNASRQLENLKRNTQPKPPITCRTWGNTTTCS